MSSSTINTLPAYRSAPARTEPRTSDDPAVTDSVSLGADQGQEIDQMLKAWGSCGPVPVRSERGLHAKMMGALDRRDAINGALESGEPGSFKNSRGQCHQLEARLVSKNEQGVATYELKVDGKTVTVNIDPGNDPSVCLARIADFWSQYPPHLQSMLRTVYILNGPSPDGDDILAQAGGSLMLFWNGEQNLREDNFDHEMGHVIAYGVEDAQDHPIERILEDNGFQPRHPSVPDGWNAAMESDARNPQGASVSYYGDTSPGEDFAEFVAHYHRAEQMGPEALAAFKAKYPQRAMILQEIFRGNYDYFRMGL